MVERARKIINTEVLQLVIYDDGFWFRIKGYGLNVRKKRRLLFSERYGYRKVLLLGSWAISVLRPNDL